MRFRKKPVVIEAFCWSGDERQVEDPEWICAAIRSGAVFFFAAGTPEMVLAIKTLEGTMRADRGDWIIRGVKGEIYPCKPDIFAATYEPADTPTPSAGEEVQAAMALAEAVDGEYIVGLYLPEKVYTALRNYRASKPAPSGGRGGA